jgi:hypothetical protein
MADMKKKKLTPAQLCERVRELDRLHLAMDARLREMANHSIGSPEHKRLWKLAYNWQCHYERLRDTPY